MSSPISFPELYKAGFDDFIIPSHEIAPFTTIQNRAKVTRSLKAIAGVERIHVKGLNRLQNEFGPNGEQVWEADTKDSRVRFVGSIGQISGADASAVLLTSTTDYVEVTFYGTGLNILSVLDGSNRSAVASIDGGAEGSALFTTGSNIVSGRNYSANQIFSVVSGLTLGWHTARIRRTGAANTYIHGFEILNQRTDLAVYQGSGIAQGALNGLSSLATSSFTDGVTGTRGARVVKYIENGTIKSSVQEVDATSKYLTLADHTNEEVVRRINFREFGANRADDFSTLSTTTSDRAFTLDDGTTTLVGNDVATFTDLGVEGIFQIASGGFLTYTFVGTGLDIDIFRSVAVSNASTYQIFVDGIEVTSGATGALTLFGIAGSEYKKFKLCSGLPYGTHTVRITRTVFSGIGPTFGDTYIYQPKKPSIPAGALEVADYNVMASFAANTTAGVDTIATGVTRKLCLRELTYVGTWTNPGVDPANYIGAQALVTVTNGSYLEYTFFGTGFEFRGQAVTTYSATNAVTLSSNGGALLALTTTNFPTITTSNYGGFTFNNATGNLSTATATAIASGFRVSGLPLGVYKIRITNNTAVSFVAHGFDIITPIHINQPSLKTGSLSLKSATKYSPEKSVSNAGPDLSKAKAWVMYNAFSNTIISSYNISAALSVSGGEVWQVFFEKPFKRSPLGFGGASNSYSPYINIYSITGDKNKPPEPNAARIHMANMTSGISYILFFGELADE